MFIMRSIEGVRQQLHQVRVETGLSQAEVKVKSELGQG